MFTGLARPNFQITSTLAAGVILGISIASSVNSDCPYCWRQRCSNFMASLTGEEDRLATHTSPQLLIDLRLSKGLPQKIDPGGHLRHCLT